MRTTLISLLLVLPWFCTAQNTPTRFSLDEAIAYGLAHNYNAINATRDTIDARKQKWETIADGLPQISGVLNYQDQIKQQVSSLSSLIIPENVLDNFFPGVEPSPDVFVDIVLNAPHTATATATLTQQIFDGSYIVAVQATKAFLRYSRTNKEKTDLQVKQDVTQAYGNVLLAQESVLISQKNKTTLEKNLYETQQLYKNGMGDQQSVDQLQITLANIDIQLRNAKRLENITLQTLNLLMGLPIETPTVLTEKLDDLTQQQIDLKIVDQPFVLERNVDYKLAHNLTEQRFYELKLAKSRALPTLNAYINYGANAFSNDFTFFERDQDWFDFSILGVNLNIPLFSSLQRSASTQRAKIALQKSETQLTQAQQQIRLQHQTAKSNYIFAIDQHQTAKQNLKLAERIEHQNQVKYTEGLATSFELRQAQTQLYTSQQQYLQAMVDVINRKTQLEILRNL